MDKKGVVIFIAVLVVLFAGLYGLSAWQQSAPGQRVELTAEQAAVQEQDHVKGNAEGDMVLVKYSDFQCPACASAYPMVDDLIDFYGDELAVVYRHFPLINQFQHSLTAALASEAAAEQDAFWPMHDLIFDGQNEWAEAAEAESIFITYAEELELDIDRFQADLKSEELREKILADRQTALDSGVAQTPSFFLNGRYVEEWNQLPEELHDLISTPAADPEGETMEISPEMFDSEDLEIEFETDSGAEAEIEADFEAETDLESQEINDAVESEQELDPDQDPDQGLEFELETDDE